MYSGLFSACEMLRHWYSSNRAFARTNIFFAAADGCSCGVRVRFQLRAESGFVAGS
jgi:hypothetical protein